MNDMEGDENLQTIDLLFDSSNFVTGSQDNPTWNLSDKRLDNIVGMQILYSTIPFSYYVIDITNNKFILTDTAVNYTIQIAPGTYNANNFVTQLVQAFKLASVPNYTNYTFFVNASTAHLIIYNNVNGFSISLPSVGYSTYIGFTGTVASTLGQITDNTNTYVNAGANTNYVISQAICNLLGANQLYLHSPELSSILTAKIFNETQQGDLLFVVPSIAPYLGYNEYLATHNLYLRCRPYSISNISMYITVGTQQDYQAQSGTITTKYLCLQGTPFQIGIRFYKKLQNAIQTTSQNQGTRSMDMSGGKRMRM